jgi:hypothetical protein
MQGTWLLPKLLLVLLLGHVSATWLAHTINLSKLQSQETLASLIASKNDTFKVRQRCDGVHLGKPLPRMYSIVNDCKT